MTSDGGTHSPGGTEQLGDRLMQQHHAVEYLMMILPTIVTFSHSSFH